MGKRWIRLGTIAIGAVLVLVATTAALAGWTVRTPNGVAWSLQIDWGAVVALSLGIGIALLWLVASGKWRFLRRHQVWFGVGFVAVILGLAALPTR